MKIFKNDVLVLEIDAYGILKKKDFYNKDDMNRLLMSIYGKFLITSQWLVEASVP